MNVLDAGVSLKNRILAGEFGQSGDHFLNVRQLAAEVGCSYVTAVKTMEWLRGENLVMLLGHEHYLTLGRCARDSALEARLAENRCRCFGLIFNSIDNHCFTLLAEHINVELNELGYNLTVMTTSSDMMLEQKQLQLLISFGVSGIFFFPHAKFRNRNIYEYCPLPVVNMGRIVPNFPRSSVTVNNDLVGTNAAIHLVTQGFRNFAYIGPRNNQAMVDSRLIGFRNKLKEFGFTLPESNIFLVNADTPHDDLYQLREQLVALTPPVGIFCYHDIIAVELLELCSASGLNIPRDVGIIGCDNLPITTACTPCLSSINYPYEKIAHYAIQTMMDELSSGICQSLHLEAPPQIIARRSTRQG